MWCNRDIVTTNTTLIKRVLSHCVFVLLPVVKETDKQVDNTVCWLCSRATMASLGLPALAVIVLPLGPSEVRALWVAFKRSTLHAVTKQLFTGVFPPKGQTDDSDLWPVSQFLHCKNAGEKSYALQGQKLRFLLRGKNRHTYEAVGLKAKRAD